MQSTTSRNATLTQNKGEDKMKDTILNTIKNQEYGVDQYETYGLRVMKDNPLTGTKVTAEAGDYVNNYESYEWVDGNPTDESLEGLCAVEIDINDIDDAIHKIQDYIEGEEQIVLIGCDCWSNGNDAWNNEIIARDGQILATF